MHKLTKSSPASMSDVCVFGCIVVGDDRYYDSRQTISASRLHSQLPKQQTSVTLGPWSHGARKNCSAHSPLSKPAFDLYEDIARFWDSELLGAGSANVSHYFTMGSEKWNAAPTWPPEHRGRYQLYVIH